MEIRSNTPLRNPPADYCTGESHWFRLTEGYDAGKTMFWYEQRVGEGEPAATVLFVHGNPESSYTWRHVRDALAASGQSLRIVAMDHIGFGLSDQASFEMVDMHHAANLRQLVHHLDLRDVILVVHDWGGPIGIGAVIDEPERVKGLVVVNSTVFPMPSDGYTYTNYPHRLMPWSMLPRVVPDRLWGAVAATAVSHGSPQGLLGLTSTSLRHMLRHARRGFEPGTPEHVWAEPLRTLNNARSSKRNVRQTPRWGHGYAYRDRVHGEQDNMSFYVEIQEQVPRVWGREGACIPAAGFFGEWDPCGKSSVVAQWTTALPRMQVHRFPGFGHFLEEYKGAEIADGIRSLIT